MATRLVFMMETRWRSMLLSGKQSDPEKEQTMSWNFNPIRGVRAGLSLALSCSGLSLLSGCGGGSPGSLPQPQVINVELTRYTAALDENQSHLFSAAVSNDQSNKGVTWAVKCSSGVSACGAMAKASSASGAANMFSAPVSVSAAETVVVMARSVSDPSKFASVHLTVNPAPAFANPPALADTGYAGQAFTLDLAGQVRGGSPPFTWRLQSGILPLGLALDATKGLVSGTLPPASGSATSLIFAGTDSGYPQISVSVPVSLTITPLPALTITNSTLPSGSVGTFYGYQICGGVGSQRHCIFAVRLSLSGGVGPFTWSWAAAPDSSLPPGLDIGSYFLDYRTHGEAIHGSPTLAGTYNVIVSVTDSELPAPVQTSAPYTITITP
jgi:hypothetical protein